MLNHNRLRLGGELESAHNRSHALVSLDVRFVPQADIPRPLTDASDVSNRLIAWQELKLPFN